jgi:hypothetical protein
MQIFMGKIAPFQLISKRIVFKTSYFTKIKEFIHKTTELITILKVTPQNGIFSY